MEKILNSRIRSYINLVALALVLIVNFLSNYIPFNNLTQEDITEIYPVLITPAGYVFSIWGIIYLLLIGFIIYQALPSYRETPKVSAVGILFAVTALLNILWLFAWHYLQIGLSMVLMILLLITLIGIYKKIIGRKSSETFFDWLFVRLPFSIYLAWISVATLANLNILLNDWGILGTEGFGAMVFTILMIIIGAVLSLYVFYRLGDIVFPLVFTWAFIGIGVRHGTEIAVLTMFAWLASAVILFLLGWIAARNRMATDTNNT
ncbi:tryptophan-rich sensory protein [Natranaerobius thermophilus]|uniref:Tryptophan-rich sensory protein n=1 Tax=Natranaerobius thermophilus (strain ATCC BAA-1301 / DSM 18059 / JW/NM-WN-LF) TaxID=457570 RepID=B2A8D4_NATTJ|nr:tryptophan-rich sensory protein [Natranaerobius thermophilus]ACB84500.1 conserved hypothetical protein [Natranaerobius thermophilus JW/NM-WN-LF]